MLQLQGSDLRIAALNRTMSDKPAGRDGVKGVRDELRSGTAHRHGGHDELVKQPARLRSSATLQLDGDAQRSTRGLADQGVHQRRYFELKFVT
jgi:hypothetical protein